MKLVSIKKAGGGGERSGDERMVRRNLAHHLATQAAATIELRVIEVATATHRSSLPLRSGTATGTSESLGEP